MRPIIVPTTDVNSETAVVNAWRVPDRALVAEGEVIAEVETSKAVLDVLAPAAGHLLHGAGAGESIRLDQPLAHMFETVAELEGFAERLAAAEEQAVADEDAGLARLTAPAARRAAELGVDAAAFPPGELVTVRMVEVAAGNGRPAEPTELPEPLDAPSGTERVALIGAGLGATQVLEILGTGSTQRAVAIFDDAEARWGDTVLGVPVAGGARRLEELYAAGRFDAAVVCIGTSVPARTRFRELCASAGIPLANAIDASARICSGVELGLGNVVCAFCHIGVGTRVGDNTFLSAYTSFDHHNVVGSDVATGPGCMTSGLVHIGDRVRLGTGVFVEPHVELGAGVQVASGAVIVGSVPAEHAVKRRVVTTAVVPLRREPSTGAGRWPTLPARSGSTP